MEIGNLIPHIESLIFASEKPLTALEITELINNAFGFMEDKIVLDQVESALEGIIEKYRSEFYPFEVRESGGGWQFLTKRDYHKTVAQLNGDKFLKRLSTAALETLSIIAYKQPVTKAEIEAIRGVSSDYAIQKLLEKELIVITGRNEKMPGHPLVYGTSKNFMDYFGINSPEDLPKLKEVFDDTIVVPTAVNEEGDAPLETEGGEANANAEESEDIASLVVGENGELIEFEGAEGEGEETAGAERVEEPEGAEGAEAVEGAESVEEVEGVEAIEGGEGMDDEEQLNEAAEETDEEEEASTEEEEEEGTEEDGDEEEAEEDDEDEESEDEDNEEENSEEENNEDEDNTDKSGKQ